MTCMFNNLNGLGWRMFTFCKRISKTGM